MINPIPRADHPTSPIKAIHLSEVTLYNQFTINYTIKQPVFQQLNEVQTMIILQDLVNKI